MIFAIRSGERGLTLLVRYCLEALAYLYVGNILGDYGYHLDYVVIIPIDLILISSQQCKKTLFILAKVSEHKLGIYRGVD